jgi:hypothetical protein
MRFGFVLAPLALLIPLATPASAAERLVNVVDFEFQPKP